MSDVMANVKATENLDLTVQIVNFDKDKGYRVLVNMIKFDAIDGKDAKVKKKVAAYHEAVSLDEAQNGAIERAASLLGL
jgi:hypothetical protein